MTTLQAILFDWAGIKPTHRIQHLGELKPILADAALSSP